MVPATVMMRVARCGAGCSREGWNRNRHQKRREHEGTKLLHRFSLPAARSGKGRSICLNPETDKKFYLSDM
jgi:hypothetical protein